MAEKEELETRVSQLEAEVANLVNIAAEVSSAHEALANDLESFKLEASGKLENLEGRLNALAPTVQGLLDRCPPG